MKKSHSLRHRILAARRARRARTLAARRQVEALASRIAWRQALQRSQAYRYSPRATVTEALNALLKNLREGGVLSRLGIVRLPPGVRTITYTAANLRRA
ncbi:hypothetical protein [Methylobacterium sp. SD21]|uniref:hypothetical protein n=1 Tax=Methylobacterium litchii TaxID=3138810 RepID=UPI00313DC7E9